jgi:cyanate permease
MIIDKTKILLILILVGLTSFGFYNFNQLGQEMLIAVMSFLTLFPCLFFASAVRYSDNRDKVNLRVVSLFFLIIFFVGLLFANSILFSIASLVIFNGITMVTYLYIINSLNNSHS